MPDDRLFSTSAARNKDIIAEAFGRLVPRATRVLEVASGTGEHAETILRQHKELVWQASDPDRDALASAAARMEELHQPSALSLDTRDQHWWYGVDGPFDAVVAINMVHITSLAGYENLFRGAAQLLAPGAPLFLYGPMSRRGQMEPSNQRFSQGLAQRDPEWGVRDLDDTLQPLGARFGLVLDHVERVPAHNHIVLFRKPEAAEN